MIGESLGALEQLFRWVLTASWQASVLALLVLSVQAVLRRRLNPRWRHALWLLVVVRLLLPVLPESALSLFQIALQPPSALAAPMTEPFFAPAPAAPVAGGGDAPALASRFTFLSLLALVWLLGAAILLGLTTVVNRRFARAVAASPTICDPELLHLFADAKAELGLGRSIRLIENGQVQSPAIMGLFRPTLLLPADVRRKFDPAELRFIFLHELAHLKRGDVAIQAVIALLQIVHWFNPVLWFAFRRLRIDREPATDALVLSRTGEQDKERYGLMLIKLLEHFNQRHSLPTLVGILEDKDQFKRRFSLIARFTRGAYGWSLLGVALIAILAVAGLTRAKALTMPTPPSAPAAEGASFYQILQRDRAFTADSSIVSSTLAADAEMLLAIQKGDVNALKEVLDHAVDPNTFDPDRFHSYPVYWAIHFNRPEMLKLLLAHFAEGNSGPANETPLQLAERIHPELVPLLREGIKHNRAILSSQLTARLQAIPIDVPAFPAAPMNDVVHFLLNATAQSGYLERRVAIGTMDLPASTRLTVSRARNISIWDALEAIAQANDLRFYVDDESITFYPPKDEAVVPHLTGEADVPSSPAAKIDATKTSVAAIQKGAGAGPSPESSPPTHTLHGQLRLQDPSPVDFVHSSGELLPVDGLAAHHYGYLFKADGSYTVPNVAEGVYNPAVHLVPQDDGSSSGKPEFLTLNLPPVTIGAGVDPTLNQSASVVFEQAPQGSIKVGLTLLEIPDGVYLANKEKIDAAVEKADISVFNHLEGISILSTPSVTTPSGVRANIDIVREFPYPTKFASGKYVASGQTILKVPPTPREFATKKVGISAEIVPSLDEGNSPTHGKIILNGKLSVTTFEGFTKSNIIGPGMASFDTSESLFVEALDDKERKGLWVPGEHVGEEGVAAHPPAAAVPLVKKRYLLFVSASLVK